MVRKIKKNSTYGVVQGAGSAAIAAMRGERFTWNVPVQLYGKLVEYDYVSAYPHVFGKR